MQTVAKIFLLLVAWIVPLSTFGQAMTPAAEQPPEQAATTEKAAASTASSNDKKPLDSVIDQVKAALIEYQESIGSGPDALPPLASADFDFTTTTDVTVAGGINLFIFKIGGSHQNEAVNDVDFTYSLPPVPTKAAAKKKPSETLKDALAKTIQSAAKAVKTERTVGKLPFSKLTVTVKYGVTWDANLGVNAPISLVTVGLSGELKNNTVQTVKLVFGK